MNKNEKLIIKAILQKRITSISIELSRRKPGIGQALRLERLESALSRIDASNFGECLSCEKPIPPGALRVSPERLICDACLETGGR